MNSVGTSGYRQIEACVDVDLHVLPPRFQEQVWRRIAQAEAPAPAQGWTQVAQWIARAFAQPSLAVSYATALLVAGLLAGYLQGRQDNNRAQHELSTRYVQMMSPYALRH